MLESILETAATSVVFFLFSLWRWNKDHKKLRERGLYYSWKGFATFWACYVVFWLWFYTPQFHDTLGKAIIGVGVGVGAAYFVGLPLLLTWAWPLIAIVGLFVLANALFPSKGK
jgi:hypothetical protein